MVHGATIGAWCGVRGACGKGHGAKVHRVKEGKKGREKKRGERFSEGHGPEGKNGRLTSFSEHI